MSRDLDSQEGTLSFPTSSGLASEARHNANIPEAS